MSSQFTKVKKGGSDLENRHNNSFQKISEKSTRKRTVAWKNCLTQKVAAPDLFSLTNQLHTLCLWYHLNNNNYRRKNSHHNRT